MEPTTIRLLLLIIGALALLIAAGLTAADAWTRHRTGRRAIADLEIRDAGH